MFFNVMASFQVSINFWPRWYFPNDFNYLYISGCNPDNPDMIGCTPLMNAIRGKLYQVVDLLLEGTHL